MIYVFATYTFIFLMIYLAFRWSERTPRIR
jgi:hypothetical protein